MWQDYFLDNFIFNKKENGFFLDVGGNDPIISNNTYFFEKNRGWTGIAFEPMPKMQKFWKKERKIDCLPVALGAENGEVEFCEYESDQLSGLSESVAGSDEVIGKKMARSYKVPLRKLSDILSDYKVTHIDFMSLDAEGSEIGVLQGIDFSKVQIDYIVMENNKSQGRQEELRKFMPEHGYCLMAKLLGDEVWAIKRRTI